MSSILNLRNNHMSSIFEATKYSPEQLKDLTKIALSLKYSYGDINDARTALGKQTILGDMLIKLASAVANSQAAFNAVTGAAKNESVEELEEGVLTEENSAKLTNDVNSLKRIGWKLDRITKHLITSKEYGVKMTSDLIASIYSPPKAPKPPKQPAPRKVSWPKDPPKSKIDDPQHAEAYLAQVIDSGESPDIYGREAYELLRNAGYTERASMLVMKNLGWDADVEASLKRTSGLAKKFAPKRRFESISNFARIANILSEESSVKKLAKMSHADLLKLHYSKFPSESDPDLRALSYQERIGILKAKDVVYAASKNQIMADRIARGKELFKAAKASINDYTSMGVVTKITPTGVEFNGKEVPFDALVTGGESRYATLTKMTKDKYKAMLKSRSDAYTALMLAHIKASPKSMD